MKMMHFRDQERRRMSLWVDKHRPKRLSKLDYHQVRPLTYKIFVLRNDFQYFGALSNIHEMNSEMF